VGPPKARGPRPWPIWPPMRKSVTGESTIAPGRSAVLCCWMDRLKVAVRNVIYPAPQLEPAIRLKRAKCDVRFLLIDSRCRRYMSALSNVSILLSSTRQFTAKVAFFQYSVEPDRETNNSQKTRFDGPCSK